jgi:hypothetical protein
MQSPGTTSAITIMVLKADADLLGFSGKSTMIAEACSLL